MAYLNANIPPIECRIRAEFLRDMEDSYGQSFACVIFGVASISGQTPLFHSLMEDGGIFWRLPIHAFFHSEESEVIPEPLSLNDLVVWDSFSPYISVTTFSLLQNKRVHYKRGTLWVPGTYMFTLDWSNEDSNVQSAGFAETPGQHKSGHLLRLDTGHFAIQPNNRVKVFDPSFVTKEEWLIERRLTSRLWSSEQRDGRVISDDDRYHYEEKEGFNER